jgi:hypothetical protein
MKTLLLISALAGALLGAADMGLAQQQPAPGAGAAPATCTEQAAFCKSGCGSYGGRDRQCMLGCETRLAECKVSGFWKNPNTGQMLPRRKE